MEPDPVGPSHVQKPFCVHFLTSFLFVGKRLQPPRPSMSSQGFKQLLIREGRECRNKGGAVKKQREVKVAQSCPTLCNPMDCIVHGILQARILEWVAFPFSMDLPNPGIEPRSPVLQADSLPAEPLGKPKNTGVGSLSLLHWIFPNQDSNQGLLHYRWILYQLSYQGSPQISP